MCEICDLSNYGELPTGQIVHFDIFEILCEDCGTHFTIHNKYAVLLRFAPGDPDPEVNYRHTSVFTFYGKMNMPICPECHGYIVNFYLPCRYSEEHDLVVRAVEQ